MFKLILLAIIQLLIVASISLAEASAPKQEESPWILAPKITSDPKLGTSLGVTGGYLYQFDADSTQSMFLVTGSYSKTESWVTGFFGQMFFDENQQKLLIGLAGGKIRNDYQDFLGSGLPAQTTDTLKTSFLRYSHSVAENWYLGVQMVKSNYAIGADDFTQDWLDLIGLTGFSSTGIGLIGEYDSRDNIRNPTSGINYVIHTVAYREGLGGDENFDVYSMKYSQYVNHGSKNVFAWQIKGRWTDDAPIGGYSSIQLRGYVRGNYLATHYTHIELEDRISFNSKWGMSYFGGIACLYKKFNDCNDSKNLYSSVGAGAIYTLKKESGIVLRAEVAVGESNEHVWYLRMGHPL